MSQQDYHLDDKYTDGVWYDAMNGDFAEIQRGVNDSGDPIVELVNPETGDVYWDMPVQVWVEQEQSDFRQVSDEAVEDPVRVVNRALRIIARNSIEELSSISIQFAIDVRYAKEQVDISEQ